MVLDDKSKKGVGFANDNLDPKKTSQNKSNKNRYNSIDTASDKQRKFLNDQSNQRS